MSQDDPRILELRAMRQQALKAGGQERIDRQHAKGKLTARERIEMLLDPGTFSELEPFAVQQVDESPNKALTDGVVTGYGLVNGRPVCVYSQDFTVNGGSLGETHGRKIARVLDLAARTGAPVVGMIDSGGARIQEGIKSLGGYAQIFKRNALYSGIVPQISLMLGPCAGGAAYSPALTDLIVMVENQAYMFLTGPEVIKTVTGEVIDQESLGGAAVHVGTSGLGHLTARDEQEAIDTGKRLLSYLPSNHIENPPYVAPSDDPRRMDESLNSIVPLDPSAPYSMHEVIERVVDLGSFLELQPTFAQNAIVGFARMDGYAIGVVSSEPSTLAGAMDIDSADKISRFVRLCDAFNLPILTFVDTPGFLPGSDQEHRGIIRHGAKVLYAYAEATVPKVSVVTRKAYGGAYIVMSSNPLGGDVAFAWPSAEIAVMGPEGAVNILYGREIKAAADPAAERDRLVAEYRAKHLNPYVSAGSGFIDDVIEPRETRARVIGALAALRNKYAPAPARKHGNMPV